MPQCPRCSFTRTWLLRRGKRKCKRCRSEFSLNIYPVHGIRATVVEWKLCINVFVRQRAILSVVAETGIGQNKVAKILNHIRVVISQDVPTKFLGPVEFDETYIGGQRKNKRLHIRRLKAKRGHGTDKLAIMGIFDRLSGQVYLEIMPIRLSMEHIFSVMSNRVSAGALVYTDGYKMYRGLKEKGFRHEYVDHDGGEYARGDIHTNNIEGFWGILKRKLSCIGGMRRNRMYLFVAEIAWRFNNRSYSPRDQEQLLLNLVTKIGGKK